MKVAILVIFVSIALPGFSQVAGDSLLHSGTSGVERPLNRLDSIKNDLNSKLSAGELPGDSTSKAALYKAASLPGGNSWISFYLKNPKDQPTENTTRKPKYWLTISEPSGKLKFNNNPNT